MNGRKRGREGRERESSYFLTIYTVHGDQWPGQSQRPCELSLSESLDLLKEEKNE